MVQLPDEYMKLAVEHLTVALACDDPGQRRMHLCMAQGYMNLAEQARKNQATDIVYETPPPRDEPPQSM